MGRPPRIAITCGSIWGNRGAEAMVVTSIGEIRRKWPTAEFDIHSYLPGPDRRLVSDPMVDVIDARPSALVMLLVPFALLVRMTRWLGIEIPGRLLPRAIRRLQRSDVMLDVSGISFADGREVFLPFNVASILPSLLLGVPVVKLSQAMGPFRNPLNKTVSSHMLGRCEYVHARGNITAAHLEQLGLPDARRATASDIAFLYKPEYSLTREGEDATLRLEQALRAARLEGRRIVAVCPSSVVLKKAGARSLDYLGLLDQLILQVVSTGHDVLVVPHATRSGLRTLRNNDLPVIESLRTLTVSRLSPEESSRVHWVDFDIASAGIRRLIAAVDLVVTSRFHAMIAALSLLKPLVVLGWSHKYLEVLEQFGLQDSCFGIESVTDGHKALLEMIRRRLEQDPAAGRPDEDRLVAVQKWSRTQFDHVDAVISRRLRS